MRGDWLPCGVARGGFCQGRACCFQPQRWTIIPVSIRLLKTFLFFYSAHALYIHIHCSSRNDLPLEVDALSVFTASRPHHSLHTLPTACAGQLTLPFCHDGDAIADITPLFSPSRRNAPLEVTRRRWRRGSTNSRSFRPYGDVDEQEQ